MKTKNLIVLSAILLLLSCGEKNKQNTNLDAGLTGEIQLSGAFALYPMAVRWASEFKKIYPNVRIDISGGGAGKGMTDALAGVVDLGMVSREIYPQEIANGAFALSVVKDAVVPTINANNPEIETIKQVGLKKEVAQKLWNDEISTWGDVIDTQSKIPVHVFTRSDACGAAETFAAWLDTKQEDIRVTGLFGDPGIASVIQRDKVAIGYNNIAYVYDQNTKKPFPGLAVIPLDLDGNGKIDIDENFYESIDSLIVAINDGRYPSPPARHLYLVSKNKPIKPVVLEFIKYILSEGQEYAQETGYIALSEEELNAVQEKIK